MKQTTWQIRAGYFCAVVILKSGICVETPPIVDYMKGWSGTKIVDYCRERWWTVCKP